MKRNILYTILYHIKAFYQDVTPPSVHIGIIRFLKPKKYQLQKDIIQYLETEVKQSGDKEMNGILEYIKKNNLCVFPYNYVQNYDAKTIQVFADESGMKYVLHEKKKMFFPANWSNLEIQNYYNGLLIEQDSRSPHRYETDKFHVKQGDILADVGAAEGIFALTNIEKVDKVYLFELEDYWIDVLQKTFEPWKNKVEIIKKYVSDITNENCITLDDFLKNKRIDFIKADIEGAEIKLLKGARNVLSASKNLNVVVCTYHNQSDADNLDKIIKQDDFQTEFSNGYVLFVHDENMAYPYFRKGVLRAMKINSSS